jgi:hypothetical protein
VRADCGGSGSSPVDHDLEPAEPVGIGDDVDRRDPAADDRELEHESRGAARHPHGAGEAVHQRGAYEPDDYRRLTELKAVHDPSNIFRLNHNIPPAR